MRHFQPSAGAAGRFQRRKINVNSNLSFPRIASRSVDDAKDHHIAVDDCVVNHIRVAHKRDAPDAGSILDFCAPFGNCAIRSNTRFIRASNRAAASGFAARMSDKITSSSASASFDNRTFMPGDIWQKRLPLPHQTQYRRGPRLQAPRRSPGVP